MAKDGWAVLSRGEQATLALPLEKQRDAGIQGDKLSEDTGLLSGAAVGALRGGPGVVAQAPTIAAPKS